MPVLFESLNDIYDRKHVNELLENLAKEENINFLSVWKDFAQSSDYQSLFNQDRLHLSPKRDSLLTNILLNAIQNFQKPAVLTIPT